MTTTDLYDIVTNEGDDGTMHPVEQLWTPGEDAVENGFIVHRGLYVTGIDDPTDDHLYPVGFVVLGHQRWADIIEAAAALVPGRPLLDAAKAAAQRVALVASKESPIRLTFTADSTLVLEAGTSDEAQAIDNVDTHLEGDELTIAFNPGFLIDGLNVLTTESVDFHFTTSTKPAVLRGHNSDDQALRYLLMPIRLKG